MFVYTVYPRTPSTGKKPSRRVEPVSRVRSVRPVERIRTVQYDDIVPQNIPGPYEVMYDQYGANEKAGTSVADRTGWARDGRGLPAGDYYIQEILPDILPLLVAWRRPSVSVESGFIQERLEGLHTIRSKRVRHDRIKR